ncbi:acyl-CoA dehydrogenase family protein [Egicoccus sp. AB-alg2]|uniref:acyl-CoA dehydrogenase family protein n=1 Tax=Egicoccus sp. AB-alg2 TaxID=3242693 RepID=UPI00359E0B99
MDLRLSDRGEQLRAALLDFMDTHVYPNEQRYHDQIEASGDRHHHPAVLEELKDEARRRGLWNLFLPDERHGAGLSNLDYAHLAELTGRSPLIAPEALNCNAPDTGNMEVLHLFGTPEQQERWLEPLLAGEIRSTFFMTEPDVASSDARNIRSRIVRDGDHYVIDGRKWWSTGAASPRCEVGIFMGVTDPDEQPYRQQSMILVPMDTPGVRVVRELPVFGHYDGHGGHPEVEFVDVRVPAGNLIGQEGDGFRIAQERLGPGRIHHCMRLVGMAERAVDLMCQRAISRETFGKHIARQGVFQHWLAQARVRIEQARLLTLKAAHLMDTVGNKGARMEISAIKIVAPAMAEWVLDKAIQTHGGAGFSNDTPLAMMWAHARTLRMADGPDEVHEMALARRELKRYLPES